MIMSNNVSENSAKPNNHSIASRAYQLWEAAGRPTERDLEFWLLAEQELSLLQARPDGSFGSATSSLTELVGRPADPVTSAVRRIAHEARRPDPTRPRISRVRADL